MALQTNNLGKTPSDASAAEMLNVVSHIPESVWVPPTTFQITDWCVLELTDTITNKKYVRVALETSLGEPLYLSTLLRIRKVWYSASTHQSGIIMLVGDLHNKARELVSQGKTWKEVAEEMVKTFKGKTVHIRRTKLYPQMSRATTNSPSSEFVRDFPMFSTDESLWDNLDI